jgi:transcriptional regulator with XRE-family HTH domain
MSQETIGQRLKFLMESLSLKVRTLAGALDLSETNVRNYISRDSKPSSDVLERILRQYPQVNPRWLLTGIGEPFLPSISSNMTNTAQIKNNSGIGINNGTATQHISLEACQRELENMRRDAASYQREIELLQEQLQGKDALIAAKEETITLLRASFTRPN